MMSNGPITWSSKKQSIVALSSCEAELTSLTEAVRQGLYIRKLLASLGILNGPLQIHSDNQSALHLAIQPLHAFHARMKHYAIKLAFVHEAVSAGHISLHYRSTDSMPADMLTKSLPLTRFQQLKSLIQLSAC